MSRSGVRNITYDITELYAFIDNLGDLCCLVYNGSGAYEPHNKQVRLPLAQLSFYCAQRSPSCILSAVGQGSCVRPPQAHGAVGVSRRGGQITSTTVAPTLQQPTQLLYVAATGRDGRHHVGWRRWWGRLAGPCRHPYSQTTGPCSLLCLVRFLDSQSRIVPGNGWCWVTQARDGPAQNRAGRCHPAKALRGRYVLARLCEGQCTLCGCILLSPIPAAALRRWPPGCAAAARRGAVGPRRRISGADGLHARYAGIACRRLCFARWAGCTGGSWLLRRARGWAAQRASIWGVGGTCGLRKARTPQP